MLPCVHLPIERQYVDARSPSNPARRGPGLLVTIGMADSIFRQIPGFATRGTWNQRAPGEISDRAAGRCGSTRAIGTAWIYFRPRRLSTSSLIPVIQVRALLCGPMLEPAGIGRVKGAGTVLVESPVPVADVPRAAMEVFVVLDIPARITPSLPFSVFSYDQAALRLLRENHAGNAGMAIG